MKYAPIFSFHNPIEPVPFSFFDIGKGRPYHSSIDVDKQADIEPMVLLNNLINRVKNDGFKCSVSFSGTYLELLETSYPDQLSDLNELVRKGSIELIGGTYYHSLSVCISEPLFEFEVARLQNKYDDLFGYRPAVFQNALHFYQNTISNTLNKLSFQACIVEMNRWHLKGMEEVVVMQSSTHPSLKILLNVTDELINSDFKLQAMNGYGVPYHKEISSSYWVGTKGNDQVTVGDLLSGNTAESLPTYSVPLPLALRNNQVNIDTLVNTPLQKDVLSIVSRLEKVIVSKGVYDYMTELGLFTSYDFLKKLDSTNQNNNGYEVYLTYVNMLADLELKINA